MFCENMDRIVLGRKTFCFQPTRQRARVDRFVAPRDVISDVRKRRTRRSTIAQQDVDIWFTEYLQKKKYMSYLDKAFGLEPLVTQPEKPVERAHTWPCRPRARAYLSTADSILDLPSYSEAAFPELLDWSNDNILVAALGRKYHKWSWRSQSLISQGLTRHRIQCCKFDPRGELLALGTDMQAVELHDNARSKRVGTTRCHCVEVDYHVCSTTALDWSPTGNSFATGCSWGVVVSFTRSAQLISYRHVERTAILVVRVSPDARYVAVAAVGSPAVVLLSWPRLEMYSNLESDTWTIRTVTWHPWRSALLGVGAVADNRAQISLWDAPSCETRQATIGHSRNSLDAMLFSHRTGELVLSLWNTDRVTVHQRSCSQLVVMSDPSTVVDQWGEGQTGVDRVRTMVFSPDGTKLATATLDEDLIIWNFLPEDKKKKKKIRCKRFSAIPVYLDETSYGCSLR
ncbi:protein cortex-like [Epargyreus clarus]|uniref:protein cortex-like n=1 Tax=Epargyreus clarus TaxID=520877 RepID=UPI003C2BC7C7